MVCNMKSNGRLFVASTEQRKKNHIKSLKANFHMDENCGAKSIFIWKIVVGFVALAIDFGIPANAIFNYTHSDATSATC